MFASIRRFFAPPIFPDDEEKTQLASWLNAIIILLIFVRVFIFFAQGEGSYQNLRNFDVMRPLLLTIASFFILRRGYVRSVAIILLAEMILGTAISFTGQGGLSSPFLDGYMFILAIAALTLGDWGVVGFTGIIGMVLIWFWFAETRGLVKPVPYTTQELLTGQLITFTATGFVLWVTTRSLRQSLQRSRQNAEDLKSLAASLEVRVAERTRALEISAEVSRRLSHLLDLDQLVLEVVNQVKNTFNYYHTHIYLLDEASQTLKMVGGTGEAGKEMLAQRHAIPINRGLVGRAARVRATIRVPDTSKEPGWLPNPLLPDTHSEIAVPIILGETVLGVLDVQQNTVNGLTQEDADLLQSIANQVAVAIQNARSFEQLRRQEEALRQSRQQYELAVEGSNDGLWDWDLTTNVVYFSPRWKAMVGYEDHEVENNFAAFEGLLHPEDRQRVLKSVGVYLEGRLPEYDVEFRFRHKDGSYRWIRARGKAMRNKAGQPYRMAGSHTDIHAAKEAQENLAKRAARDRVLNRISTKIRGAASMEQILQVAVQEVRQATHAARSIAIIDPNEDTMSLPPLREQK